jgi:hypothetical protein
LVVSLILRHGRKDHLYWYDWIAVAFDAMLYGGIFVIIASLIGKNISGLATRLGRVPKRLVGARAARGPQSQR